MENQKNKEVTGWNKLIFTILNIPGARVDRIEFLVEALRPHCTSEGTKKTALQHPIDIVPKKLIAKIADDCIIKEAKTATFVSTATGMPGGVIVFVAIPIDLLQYYYHTLITAQKLAYLYGYPDLRERDGRVKDSAYDLLTIFLGAMLESDVANRAVKEITRTLPEGVAFRSPQVNTPTSV